MDEDDSQGELINKNTSHGKGKRAAMWAISDDSDDVEDGSDEGDSNSDEEEEDHLDGEEDDEGEEEENEESDSDDEEEEEDNALEGAVGRDCADLAELSSDEDTEKCPICLNAFISQPVATPESCEHYFCLDCILEWSKNANSCPVDRKVFSNIYLRKCHGGKVQKMITVQKPLKEGQEDGVDLDLDQTSCEVCGGSDREDRLLLCDGCDAGYHMECLTPPLDAVPVEEWFCPECEANNHLSRGSGEEISEVESLSSSSRPTTSRSRSSPAGPTRAIARTQQSERVRASVNRHRITQARTAQVWHELAPRYLMQSTWLDETINAVVAGLNSAVYIRDLTPRAASSHRRRKVRRRKGKKSKVSSTKGEKSKAASTGVKRRKRKVRKTKSRKRLVGKKQPTPRDRIARNLRIAKPKKGSSLPTVYRPSEQTLGNMRVDIGAASLSVYGDPFDLDPFVDGEEDEHQTQVTSLLEAKRRGISHSALRSHQPVAQPITAGLSRRVMGLPQSGGVVEAAPVPDLLGSILSGQSMLLMDSSDVVINRDGSLKAIKPISLSPTVKPSSSTGEASTQVNPGISPNPQASSLALQANRDLLGSSCEPLNRSSSSQSSHHLFPITPSALSPSQVHHTHTATHSHALHHGHPRLQPLIPHRPSSSPGLSHRGTNGLGSDIGIASSSIHPAQDMRSWSKEIGSPRSIKAPVKPVWVDVSVLPRIPKIKQESRGDGNSQDGIHRSSSSSSKSSSSNKGSGKNATVSDGGNSNGMPEIGMHSLAGDQSRQQSVDQKQDRPESQGQRHGPDRAGPSSAFSNSFSSSSSCSSSGSPAPHPCLSSSSSMSSTTVSFRINSSGNSWHTRRLSNASSRIGEGSTQQSWSSEDEEGRKRQQRRDKQMLLASCTLVKKEKGDSGVYDPFQPTLSDSSSLDSEEESQALESNSQDAAAEEETSGLGSSEGLGQGGQSLVPVKAETLAIKTSQEKSWRDEAFENVFQEDQGFEHVKVERELGIAEVKVEQETVIADTQVEKEPGFVFKKEVERAGVSLVKYETTDPTPRPPLSLVPLKTERENPQEEGRQNVQTSNSIPSIQKSDLSSTCTVSRKKKQKTEIKSEPKDSPDRPKYRSRSCSRSRSSSHGEKTPKGGGPSKDRRSGSSSSETIRRRVDQHGSSHRDRRRKKDEERERSSRRSRSKERRRARSPSESSRSDRSDRSHRKRYSRSRSRDRRRSRSPSSSSSRERSRRKKHMRESRERNNRRGRDRDRGRASSYKRHGRSRSKSKSWSRSRSRSRERRKDYTRSQPSSSGSRDRFESRSKDKKRPRSRSYSRERRKEEGSSKSSQKASGSSSSSKEPKDSKDKKKEKGHSQSAVKGNKDDRDKKPEIPSSTSVSEGKKETKHLSADCQVSTEKMVEKPEVLKEIKKEKLPYLDMFEDTASINSVKKQETEIEQPSPSIVKGIYEEKEIKTEQTEPIKIETYDFSHTAPSEMMKIKPEPHLLELPHHLIPDIPSSSTEITLDTSSTPAVAAGSPQDMTAQHPPVSPAPTEHESTILLAATVKQEADQHPDSDEEDFNVDMMLDNLVFKSEKVEGTDAIVKQEKDEHEVKGEGEQVSVPAGARSKAPVKRVTWNIQEPEGPQPEKSAVASKLALYKLKLKQEGARRPSASIQTISQNNQALVCDPTKRGNVTAGPLNNPSGPVSQPPEGSVNTGQGETSEAEEGDVLRKDKYLKKLHMQERAIEEVKLAIKPFYQKRDINKDEYKEILRKAVQKVCHSKSGEINPVKVANLVKAYVDKYKHARKHKKGEDGGKEQEAQNEGMKTSESP
ncbi:PHD and RING finger domain-containing protein 1 [Lampris incognitus]|uniref:PHD and RING finger domain-containing protein 1 n=1 Tax=Lampris incognitus TaxID=2546036 RepID=UPI0024B55543|nr:PHD and RING finger domain-containing protein 1 [Lampris incognitus]